MSRHPAIGTTDELELQPFPSPSLSPITTTTENSEECDFKLCGALELESSQCIEQLWSIPSLFDENTKRSPTMEFKLSSSSLFNDSNKNSPTEKTNTTVQEKNTSMAIPKLVRQSQSAPVTTNFSAPIFLVSMAPLQSCLWDTRKGELAWGKFISETKIGVKEFSLMPEHILQRRMRIAMMCCAFQLSGCETIHALRLCMHKWLHLPHFDDFDSTEALLLNGEIKTIREICEQFTPLEGAHILQGIYKVHHLNLHEFHLA
jgi:hypothetical protein